MVNKKIWSPQGYHFQFMPHMEEEATMMMHNIITVLNLKSGDDVKSSFPQRLRKPQKTTIGKKSSKG